MWLFLFCHIVAGVVAAPKANEFDRQKAQILIDLGLKKQGQGQVEDAVAAFEDAHEINPADSYPLLLKANVYCFFGIYQRAEKTLASITPASLTQTQKVLFHTLQARIALASESLEIAAVSYNDVLKLLKDDPSANIRLAVIKECFGSSNEVAAHLAKIREPESLACHDLALLLTLQMFRGDFAPAYGSCVLLADKLPRADFQDEDKPHLLWLWKNAFALWLSNLFFAFGNASGWFYLVFLLGLLALVAIQFSPETGHTVDLIFLVAAGLHLFGFWALGMPGARVAMLADRFSFHSPVWIIPRLLCGIHLITLSLFLIFPVFSILPQRMRPQRSELYGIWFFCFWFMLFVLIFQSRIGFVAQIPFLLISLAAAAIASMFIPMGRFLLFLVANQVGLARYIGFPGGTVDGSSSFTDGKILEAKAAHHLEREEFEQAILVARQLFSSFSLKAFPGLSITMAKAQIEKEDFFEAERTIQAFLEAVPDSSQRDVGLLISAFLRSLKGDHAGALSVINGISGERAHAFGSEQVAWSLFVLAQCNRHFGNPVQAHIDFSKALPVAVSSLTKARIIGGLTLMDVEMNRTEWAQKWLTESKSLKGGPKTQSYVKTIESLIAFSKGSLEDALKKSEDACRQFERNSFAMSWRGRLLCKMKRYSEAEALLEKMTHGTEDAEKLMQDITKKS